MVKPYRFVSFMSGMELRAVRRVLVENADGSYAMGR